MKFQIFFFPTLIGIITGSCSDEDESNDNQNLFFWNQTQCADPWETGGNNSNSETEMAVILYLENEGITVTDLYFDQKSPLASACSACNCGTDQRIILRVNPTDATKMIQLGFYQ